LPRSCTAAWATARFVKAIASTVVVGAAVDVVDVSVDLVEGVLVPIVELRAVVDGSVTVDASTRVLEVAASSSLLHPVAASPYASSAATSP
jgi:hypothetical protein